MAPLQIEAWALRVIDSAKNGQLIEDAQVELKANWIPAEQAARRIAGHANAARGNPVLWIIGVHETKGVWGVEREEFATWISQVKAQFDGVTPNLTEINLSIEGKTVVAILFETDRAPFVVKNPDFNKSGGGKVRFEVPWREGTSVRSANRNDLIRLLSPLQQVPDIEGVEGQLVVGKPKDGQESLNWTLHSYFYITPRDATRIVAPLRKASLSIECPNFLAPVKVDSFVIKPEYPDYSNRGTLSEVIIYEPGMWAVNTSFKTDIVSGVIGADAIIKVSLSLVPSGLIASGELSLPKVRRNPNVWENWASGKFRKMFES